MADDVDGGADLLGQRPALDADDLKMGLVDGQQQLVARRAGHRRGNRGSHFAHHRIGNDHADGRQDEESCRRVIRYLEEQLGRTYQVLAMILRTRDQSKG